MITILIQNHGIACDRCYHCAPKPTDLQRRHLGLWSSVLFERIKRQLYKFGYSWSVGSALYDALRCQGVDRIPRPVQRQCSKTLFWAFLTYLTVRNDLKIRLTSPQRTPESFLNKSGNDFFLKLSWALSKKFAEFLKPHFSRAQICGYDAFQRLDYDYGTEWK